MSMDNQEKKNDESLGKSNWQWFVCMTLLIILGGLLVYCAWPQKRPALQDLLGELKQQMTPIKEPHIVKQETTASKSIPVYDIWGKTVTPPITTFETSSTTKTSNLPESYVVSQEDMDKILTTVAFIARKDALNEYKQNFSILLAILAAFGIAWPAIVAILQFRFNERELKKYKKRIILQEK